MAKQTNHFLIYLQQDRFYHKIYDEVYGFFKNNKELILSRLHDQVNRIYEIQECELDFKNVWIDSKSDSRIEFDITIAVDLSVIASYGKNHDRDNYTVNYIWVNVNCSGDISEKLKDFQILGVEEYNKSKPKKPLSGDLVPIISREEYSKYANEILEKYYPEALKNPMNIDVDELAKRMGLKIYDKKITIDGSIFGQIFFKESIVELYSKKKETMKKYKVPADTIIVDTEVSYLYSFGSRSMTIAHECIHYALHKKAFEFAQMMDKDLKFIQCEVNGGLKGGDSESSTYWMELQANAIAPHILMPYKTFKAKIEELYKGYKHFVDFDILTYIEGIIKELAEYFGVTIYAARKRMIDVGYDVAAGALNWIDGHYVRPYSFKSSSLSADETYTVSYKDVINSLFSNPETAIGLIYNNYVFVENHVCIDDPKYIKKDMFGNLVLTEYARWHIDECCLKFSCKTSGMTNKYGLVTFCYLGRDCHHGFDFELSLPEGKNQDVISKAKTKENYDKYLSDLVEMRKISNMSLPESLKYLIDYLDINLKELEFDSGIDERTIRRYTNGENKVPQKKTLVAICRGMKLPSQISELVLNRGGLSFIRGDRDDEAYLIILTGMLKDSIEQVNQFLIRTGCEPLTNEKS